MPSPKHLVWPTLVGALSAIFLFATILTPSGAATDPLQLASAQQRTPTPAGGSTPANAPTGGDQERIAPGRIVVKFRASSSPEEAARVIAEEGFTARGNVGRTGARVVQTRVGHEREAIERLARRPQVEYAEPDYIVTKLDFIPADPLYAAQQWDLAKINMVDAWNVTRGANTVKVAVIDTGIMPTHPDLADQWAYASGHSPSEHVFLSPPLSDGCTAPDTPTDDDGHGTHVSGTIAAASTIAGGTATGIAGIAPGVRIIPLKALDCEGSGYLSDLSAAIDFAVANGATLVNMSLGGQANACPSYMQNAVAGATAAGVLVVAAAGNDGTTAINYPAGCIGAIGIGATSSSDAIASFSNRNSTVKLSAPGVGIVSTWKDGGYASLSGTSMAAPHITGCAALMKSANPGLTGAMIESLLEGAAIDLGAPGYDTTFGAGRLNCGAAVQAASGGSAPTPTATAPGGPTPTRTPTPTSAPVTVGGRGFGISSGSGGVQLSWQGGNGQTGYRLLRMAGGATTQLPLPGPLPADATSFTDLSAPAGVACYALLPLGTTPQAISDFVCTIVGFHTATGSPQSFTLRLNQSSSASLSWAPPANTTPDFYILVPLGGQGQALAGSSTSTSLSASGLACYFLAALRANTVLGYTDILCGLPGISNLGA